MKSTKSIRGLVVALAVAGSTLAMPIAATLISSSPASADPTLGVPKIPYPIHPKVFVANLHKVTATREQDCKFPSGKFMNTWYCGGYKVNYSLTFNPKAQIVTQTQEQGCTYPVGNIKGTWYCGEYVKK